MIDELEGSVNVIILRTGQDAKRTARTKTRTEPGPEPISILTSSDR